MVFFKRAVGVCATAAVLALCAGPGAELAQAIVTPPGLNPGDEYRIAFVTSERISTSIFLIDINDDVNTQANMAGAETAGLAKTWKAIVSLSFSTTKARENSGTDTPGGSPIFLVDGTRIADDNDDLWDGSIQNPLSLDQFGAPVTDLVMTGTNPDGTPAAGFELGGSTDVTMGDPTSATSTWVSDSTAPGAAEFYQVYAISDVLTVPGTPVDPVPEPVTSTLGAMGVASIMMATRRRRIE